MMETRTENRYEAYRDWCSRIGITPASFTEWERINRKVDDNSFAFAPPMISKTKQRNKPRRFHAAA